MLPKSHRLTKKGDFEKVKEQGERVQGKFFGLLFLKTGNCVSRFGFVFSTKFSKKAVLRNRVKRIFREAVRGLLSKIKPGYDVVFLGKKEVLGRSFFEVSGEIERIIKKAGLLK